MLSHARCDVHVIGLHGSSFDNPCHIGAGLNTLCRSTFRYVAHGLFSLICSLALSLDQVDSPLWNALHASVSPL